MAKLNFANYSFDELVAQLRNIVSQTDSWQDIAYESGTGNFLIELFAYVAEMLMYYLERRAQEGYIDTAQLRSSLVSLVALINYRPKRQISSTGYLTFNLPGGWYAKDIYIPKGTRVQTTGFIFTVLSNTTLRSGDTSVVTQAIQGEYTTETFVSDGTSTQTLILTGENIEDTHIEVFVNGVPWALQDTLAYSTSESLDFIQKTALNGAVQIIFGDGIFGAMPTISDTIEVKYISTDGIDGSVYSLSVINDIVDTLYDSASIDVTSLLTVVNNTQFLGGDSEEDIEEIRREAPLVYKTGQRAVTREDYITILESIGGVMTAYAWGERDETPPNITYFNKIRIVVLLDDWQDPDSAFKASIESVLEEKEQLTVWIEFVDAVKIETIATVGVKVNSSYQTSTIVADVSDKLDELFALGTVKLGTAVRISDIVAGLDGLTGVDYVHLAFTHKENIGTGDTFLLNFTGTLSLDPILPSSVYVYKAGVVVGADDGFGNITGTLLTGGSVVYATGVVSVTFATPPAGGASIDVYYKQDEDGDMVVGKKEIVRLTTKTITTL